MSADPRPRGLVVDGLVVDGHRGFTLGPLSLEVAPGESVLVFGGASSGKSLLLLALAGLVDARGGRATLDGDALVPVGAPQVTRRVGLTFQRDALVPDETALENVARAARGRSLDEPDERARRALDDVGIAAAHHARLPRALSGGMRRRVGLARALVTRPSLLLLDDPTAGLDPETAREVAAVLTEAARDAASVIVTHDVDLFVSGERRVLVLERGRVVAQGPWRTALDDARAAYRPRAHEGIR